MCAPVGRAGVRRPPGDRRHARARTRPTGSTYDRMWRGAVRAAADVVTITSYNEWHEGTQIEPARTSGGRTPPTTAPTGSPGRAAQRAYLDRTAMWVERYRAP